MQPPVVNTKVPEAQLQVGVPVVPDLQVVPVGQVVPTGTTVPAAILSVEIAIQLVLVQVAVPAVKARSGAAEQPGAAPGCV